MHCWAFFLYYRYIGPHCVAVTVGSYCRYSLQHWWVSTIDEVYNTHIYLYTHAYRQSVSHVGSMTVKNDVRMQK